MEKLLNDLVDLFIQALPTVAIIVFLNFFLRAVLFKPLGKVLAERDSLTKGAKETAEQSMKLADQKSAELEAKLRDARSEVYKEQETQRRQWAEAQAKQVSEARASADAMIQAARQELAKETEVAKASLNAQAAALAEQIEKTVLGRTA